MVSNQIYDVPFNWRETKCGPKITNDNVEIVEIVKYISRNNFNHYMDRSYCYNCK